MEKVEAVLKKNSYVEQIWVYGNSYESQLVAVVVPIEVRLWKVRIIFTPQPDIPDHTNERKVTQTWQLIGV